MSWLISSRCSSCRAVVKWNYGLIIRITHFVLTLLYITFEVPRSKEQSGDSAFSILRPRLWNKCQPKSVVLTVSPLSLLLILPHPSLFPLSSLCVICYKFIIHLSLAYANHSFEQLFRKYTILIASPASWHCDLDKTLITYVTSDLIGLVHFIFLQVTLKALQLIVTTNFLGIPSTQ